MTQRIHSDPEVSILSFKKERETNHHLFYETEVWSRPQIERQAEKLTFLSGSSQIH